MECREKGEQAGRADSMRGVKKRDHIEEIKTLASLTHAEMDGWMKREKIWRLKDLDD